MTAAHRRTLPPSNVPAIMLAGGLRPGPLAEALDLPVPALPLGDGDTLISSWLRALAAPRICRDLLVVVSRDEDVAHLLDAVPDDAPLPVRVQREPRPWRGAAGTVRDIAEAIGAPPRVLVLQASMLPPPDLAALIADAPDDADAVVGIDRARRPAGVYLLGRTALRAIPAIGYHDLKEQLLPALHAAGAASRAAVLGPRAVSLRDRQDYLQLRRRADGPLIDPGAAIGARTSIRDSVVMAGAQIGDGASVHRSIVGPGAVVPPGATVVDRIVGRATSHRAAALG